MQALIVYYSLTGRTAKAVKYIKKGLEEENVVVSILNSHKAQEEDLRNKEIVLFGTPVHLGSPAMDLRRFLNRLSENALSGKKIASFATYLFTEGTTISTIEEIARDKGATHIIPGLARRASFLLTLWNSLTGSTESEEAWVEFGRLIATS